MKGAPRPRPPKGQSWRCSYACSSPCSTPCVHILLTSQCHLHAAQQCHFPVSIMARSKSKNWTLHRRFSQSRWAAGIKVHKLRAAVQAGGGRPECQSTAHTHHAALSAGAQLHDNPCHQPQCALINAWLIRETRSLLWRKKDYYKFQLFFLLFLQMSGKKQYFERIMTQMNTSTSMTVPFSAEPAAVAGKQTADGVMLCIQWLHLDNNSTRLDHFLHLKSFPGS